MPKSKQNFFVHDLLSTFRDEAIPFYYNPRHMTKITKDQYRERPIFNSFIADNPDVVSRILLHDSKYWSLR